MIIINGDINIHMSHFVLVRKCLVIALWPPRMPPSASHLSPHKSPHLANTLSHLHEHQTSSRACEQPLTSLTHCVSCPTVPALYHVRMGTGLAEHMVTLVARTGTGETIARATWQMTKGILHPSRSAQFKYVCMYLHLLFIINCGPFQGEGNSCEAQWDCNR